MTQEIKEQPQTVQEPILTSFTMNTPDTLRDVITIVAQFTNEAVIKFAEDGLRMRALDASGACLFDLVIKGEEFIHKTVGDEHKFRINVQKLLLILKKTKKEDMLTIVFDNPIRIEAKGKRLQKFELPQLDLHDRDGEQKFPDILDKYDVNIELSTDILKEIHEGASLNEGAIQFQVTEDAFVCSSEGDITSVKWRLELPFDDEHVQKTQLKYEDEEQTKPKLVTESLFSQMYFMHVVKAGILSDKVTVRFANNMPLFATYVKDNVSMSLVIGPRVLHN